MTGYTEFTDNTGSNVSRSPFVTGGFRAGYITGSGGIEWTSAQIAAAEAAGMVVGLYDQSPSLSLFASGQAEMADVEPGAGTIAAVAEAIVQRRTGDIQTHTVYCSYDSLPAVRASITDLTGVWFGVADYSWSLAQAQTLLAANADWGYIQFGDPASNPLTLVPGTGVDLTQAQADINVASNTWLTLITQPVPIPLPVPQPTPPQPAWPFTSLDYLGTPRPDIHCHSGYYSSADAHVVAIWQQRMKDRGWTISVDGQYGLNETTLNQGQSPAVCAAFQAEKGLKVDHLVGPVTWAAAWTAPVTP